LASVARFIAAGLGGGWMPFAPGTFGSLTAAIAAWLMLHAWGAAALWIGWSVLLPVACWSTYTVLSNEADTDPAWIVVDEWLGQWLTLMIALLVLPASGAVFICAFAAFRFFDILKPGPIRKLEHMGPAWWAIHADDLLAGVFAGLTLIAGGIFLDRLVQG